MIRLLLVRVAQALLTLFLGSIVIFFSARLTGNPINTLLSDDARPEQIAQVTRDLGLDKPLLQQYAIWVSKITRGDLGMSIQQRTPVWDLLRPRVANSLKLAAVAVGMAAVIGIPLGVAAAVRRGKFWDRLAMAGAVLGQALPSWWTAMVLTLVFAVQLGLLPVVGADSWKHYILPGFSLGWFASAGVMRLVRSSMLEILDSEFVKLARIKGLSEGKVIWKHALRNALIPAVTFMGLMFGVLIGAAIAVETVFAWPGMGTLAYRGLINRDFPVVQGVVLVWLLMVIVVSFSVDIVYGLLDPRTRR